MASFLLGMSPMKLAGVAELIPEPGAGDQFSLFLGRKKRAAEREIFLLKQLLIGLFLNLSTIA
jgi:hypothetical protein